MCARQPWNPAIKGKAAQWSRLFLNERSDAAAIKDDIIELERGSTVMDVSHGMRKTSDTSSLLHNNTSSDSPSPPTLVKM